MLSLTNYYRLSYGAFGVHLMLCSTSSLSLQNCKHIKLQFSYHAGFIEACSAVWNFQGVLCHPYLSLHLYDILNDTNVRGFVIGATNALFQQKANLTDVVVEVGNSTSYLLHFHSFMIQLPVFPFILLYIELVVFTLHFIFKWKQAFECLLHELAW